LANQAATVVLVHGAWHGAWCWDSVTERLDSARVPSVAVDNPSVAHPPSTMHDDADHLRRTLDEIDGPVVLLGHSYGGSVITDAGTHDAVRHLVYLTAFALDKGETPAQNGLTGGEGSALDGALQFEDDMVTVDPDLAVVAFYHDCPEAVARDAVQRLRPQSTASLLAAPRAIAWRERPSTYVVCTEDRGLPPALQRSCAARIGSVVEMPTSHSPFLSRPDLVADLLIGLSRA
jgi:pimeloyl-ACP methyl ester carboxylesterase